MKAASACICLSWSIPFIVSPRTKYLSKNTTPNPNKKAMNFFMAVSSPFFFLLDDSQRGSSVKEEIVLAVAGAESRAKKKEDCF